MPARGDYYWRKSDSHPGRAATQAAAAGGAIGEIIDDIVHGQ
jgi:hypothetical protein